MNYIKFLAAGLLAASLALPLGASAQQAPPPPANQPAQRHPGSHGHHRMPPFARAMHAANLTAAQKTQMRQIRQQYRAAHPPHSGRNPAAMKALRTQLLNVLTPAQRTQVQQRLAQMRANRPAHRMNHPARTPGNTVFPANTPQP